jgi:hypothetical protein
MLWWESWTFGILCVLDFYVALAMVIEIIDYHSGAEDYCDGVMTLVYALLCCNVPPPLLLSICCLPSLILAVLPGAYVPLGLLDLAVLCTYMFVLPRALLLVSLV